MSQPRSKSSRVPAVATRESRKGEKAGAKIVEHTLSNGMQVLLAERHGAPVVAVLLLYRVGVRNEDPRVAGISHFLEHMMFKGTAKYGKGQIDQITAMLGGSNNAFTTPDHTGYWFEFASDRWERALEVEADRMRGLLLQDDEFEAEKAVVLEELAMGEDDPWRALSREVQTLLFPRHPYGRPVVGFTDTLQAMRVDQMRAFYDRHYSPDNATLVLCGDITHAQALKVVRKHFDGISARVSDAEVLTPPPILEPKSGKRLLCHWEDDSRRLCMAWPTTPVGTDEDYALDILTVVATGGRNSRFHRRLVLEGGLATSVSLTNDTRVDGGALWLSAECATGVRPETLEAAIDEEFENLACETISAKEISRARGILAASEAYENETVTDLAEELGEYAVDIHWQLALQGNERLAAIRPAFLRDVVRRYLQPERRVLGWSLPKGERLEGAGA